MAFRSIKFQGVLHQPRVLLSEKELIGGDPSVAPRVFGRSLAQFLELVHRLVLARLGQAEGRRKAVSLRVLAEVFEARITVTRPPRRLWVDFIEVRQDLFNGCKSTVEAEAVEADLHNLIAERVVVISKPFDEIEHVGVHRGSCNRAVTSGVIVVEELPDAIETIKVLS